MRHPQPAWPGNPPFIDVDRLRRILSAISLKVCRAIRCAAGKAGTGSMSTGKSVDTVLSEMRRAMATLESAVDARIDRERQHHEADGEVRRVHADRARLAQELDQAEFRANRLEEVNREVSRRLVTAMETIRAVLDR
jgi:hypothetical protein